MEPLYIAVQKSTRQVKILRQSIHFWDFTRQSGKDYLAPLYFWEMSASAAISPTLPTC